MFGTYGASNIGLFLSYYDHNNQVGIFRVSHNSVHLLGAILCFINSREAQPLYVYLENTSGTIKKAKTLLRKDKYIQKAVSISNFLIKNLDDDTLHS